MYEVFNLDNVSRETINELEIFQNLVLEYNNKFNLISKSSETDIWNRHIMDSLQIINLLKKEDGLLYDLGSGAGFPGIVLAIARKKLFPNLKIKLIESVGKKAAFLNYVNEKMSLDIDIINDRIEKITLPKADVITSRALAGLEKLFDYAYSFCSSKTKLIFLKGEKWKEEVFLANKKWFFKYHEIDSITSKTGKILYIEEVKKRKTCQK